MKPTLALALFPFLLGSCLVDAALDYDEIHVSATRADGSAATTSPVNGCTTLPILLGSRIERTVRIDSEIDVDLDATRDGVRVSLRHVAAPEAFSVPAEDLRAGSFARDLPVQSQSGQNFLVRLRSTCSQSPGSSDAGSD